MGKGTISGSIAKQVLETMFETGDNAGVIVEREGLKQESDTGAIEAKVDGFSPPMPTRSPSTAKARLRFSASSSARR